MSNDTTPPPPQPPPPPPQPQPMTNIAEPTSKDVLCGRGNAINDHNVHYRYLVQLYKEDYISAPRNEKAKYSYLIVHAVRTSDPPGRFLTKDPKTRLWYDMGDKKALVKVKQALREDAPEIKRDMRRKEGRLEAIEDGDDSRDSLDNGATTAVTSSSGDGPLDNERHDHSMNLEFLNDGGDQPNLNAKRTSSNTPIPLYSHESHSDFALDIWKRNGTTSTPSSLSSLPPPLPDNQSSDSSNNKSTTNNNKKGGGILKPPSRLSKYDRDQSIPLESLAEKETTSSVNSKLQDNNNNNRLPSSTFLGSFIDMSASLNDIGALNSHTNLTDIFRKSFDLSCNLSLGPNSDTHSRTSASSDEKRNPSPQLSRSDLGIATISSREELRRRCDEREVIDELSGSLSLVDMLLEEEEDDDHYDDADGGDPRALWNRAADLVAADCNNDVSDDNNKRHHSDNSSGYWSLSSNSSLMIKKNRRKSRRKIDYSFCSSDHSSSQLALLVRVPSSTMTTMIGGGGPIKKEE